MNRVLCRNPRRSVVVSCSLIVWTAVTAGAGVLQWTAFGPPGARTNDIEVDPVSGSTVYLGGFGVFKSTDGGASWSATPIGQQSTDIRVLAVNPANPSNLLAGSYDAGVLRSTDGGATWTQSNQGLPGVAVISLAVDPSTPSIVFTGVRYEGVHRSTDGGRTWQPANDGVPDNASATVFGIDPGNSQTIFVGTYDGLLASVDGGDTWTVVEGGLLTRSVAAIAIDPADTSVVYVGFEGQGVYKSTDGGETWSSSNTGLGNVAVEDLAIDPTETSTLHLATDGSGLFKSTDAGATWTQPGQSLPEISFNAVSVVPSSPDTVFAGSVGAGMYRSTDGGDTWETSNDGLDASWARSVLVDRTTDGRLWATTTGGFWESADSAVNWVSRNGDLPIIHAGDAARDAVDGDTFFVATWRGVYKTENAGAEWTLTSSDPMPRNHEMVATHPTIAGRVYAGNSSGLVVSGDGGATWEAPVTGPRDQRVVSFAFDPISPATMYAGAWRGIFRSDDGGATWASSLDDETIWSIAVDPVVPDNLYVCTYHGVFKSTDGGASWVGASTGLTAQYCWALEIDPDDASTIYQASDEGVFRSANGASSWSPFPGLEAFRVYDLAFSRDRNTLFAATYGAGVAAYSFGGSSCALECSAIVPETAFAGSEAYFQAETTAVGCAASPTYVWSFGDGSPGATMQSIGHTYDAAGSFEWSMTAIADGVSCSAEGTIEVAPQTDVVMVPGAAHAPGAGGTSWRTDLAAVNRGPGQVVLTLTFIPYAGGPEIERSHALAAGHAVEWRDVLTTLFGIGPGDSAKGTIRIDSIDSVFVTARTYNQTSTGTFGQYLPALPASVASSVLGGKGVQIARHGETGVIPHLKKTADYRSNLGVQNLGAAPVDVEIKLVGADGSQLGESRTKTVATGRYWQLDDVFARLGAGSPEIAYATVEVLSEDGLAWFYGSVVDNATGDPTTVPVLLPRMGASGIAGIAHAPGAGGTTWRTDIAAVHLGSAPAQIELAFTKYNGGASSSAQTTMAAGGTTEWRDVLVSLFGRDPATSVKGTLTLGSMPDVVLTARTYNQTDSGTFGQVLPAVTAAEGFGDATVGVIPQLKKTGDFRSNLGVLNLSPFEVVTEVVLFDDEGRQVGKTGTKTVPANEYSQIDDVFAALEAGTLDVGYATVEVVTAGGRVWAYGSVIDNATGDPTTIPALTR